METFSSLCDLGSLLVAIATRTLRLLRALVLAVTRSVFARGVPSAGPVCMFANFHVSLPISLVTIAAATAAAAAAIKTHPFYEASRRKSRVLCMARKWCRPLTRYFLFFAHELHLPLPSNGALCLGFHIIQLRLTSRVPSLSTTFTFHCPRCTINLVLSSLMHLLSSCRPSSRLMSGR